MSNQLKHAVVLLVTVTLFLMPALIHAQPTDPGCDPLDPNCPIDGGLSLLVAAGIGLGARKSYQLAKKTKQNL